MTIYAGHAQRPVFLGDLQEHFLIGQLVVIGPQLLLKLGRIGRLARQADSACFEARGIDLELVANHVGMSPGFVVFHTKAPTAEQKSHIGIFRQLVVGGSVGVESSLVLAFAGRLGLLGLLPQVILVRVGLASNFWVDLTVGNGDRS